MRLIDANDVEYALAAICDRESGIPLAVATWLANAVRNAPTVDAVPTVHGRWEWFEEWNPSTPDTPKECEDCGWRCGRCRTALEDMVGGYWDNYFENPKLNYCPNCGAKMDGDKNG